MPGISDYDFITWTVVIILLAECSYLYSWSGWWTPPVDLGVFQTWIVPFSTSPPDAVTGVFGWELVKAILMMAAMMVVAPPYFTLFMLGMTPEWLWAPVTMITGTMWIFFYIGWAQIILRIRGGV